MGKVIHHRGPDDEGMYVGPGIAMGMRRLSIIDLSGGHQPISNEDGSIWVVCNGEIYNFQGIREELIQQGHKFKTGSDTEVLVHLYEQMGLDFVRRLRGMYAIALWDSNHQRLVLVRDRVGKKPLYVRREANRILFASEIKSILEDESVPRRIDPEALDQYLALGYVPAPKTLFEGIEKVLPAHYLVIEKNEIRSHEYWDVHFGQTEKHSEDEWVEILRNKFLDAVRVRLISDVPLGAFLSGGIDSSSIVASMANIVQQPVKTYAIGFEGPDSFYNETAYARIVAERYRTDHHEIIVKPDIAELLPKLIWHMDEPIGDSAYLTTYLVSKLARESVTVILSGVGGDEFFGGYRRYLGENLAKRYRRIPRPIRSLLASALAHLPQDRHSNWKNNVRYAAAFAQTAELNDAARYSSYITVFSSEMRQEILKNGSGTHHELDVLKQHFERCKGADPLDQFIYVDLKTSLADDLLALTDKMTMAASIECRAPFMDHELIELTARMPSNLKIRGTTMKYILKKVMEPWLPKEILYRKKRGFGAPMGSWIRKEMGPLLQDTLSEEQLRRRGIFEPSAVRNLIARHDLHKADYTDHLLSLISLELWQRAFIDARPTGSGMAQAVEAVAQ
jgi:asparagine synthase (glutamine-hydrolysing)